MKNLLLVCVLLLASCSQVVKPAPTISTDDAYAVKLNLQPLPPIDTRLGQSITLRLILIDGKYQIVMTEDDYFKMVTTVDIIIDRVGALQLQLDEYKNFYEGANSYKN